jgi:integrase
MMAVKKQDQVRGVFERTPGVWYVRWTADGRLRKEVGGTRAAAKKLYSVRKGEALKGIPHKFHSKRVTFGDLAASALEYSKGHKKSFQDDVERMAVLVEWFGNKPADSIRPQDIERRLSEASTRTTRKVSPKHPQKSYNAPKKLSPATVNKYKALASLCYRLGVENGRVTLNPARIMRRLPEVNGKVRFLTPDEQTRLKAVIEPQHPERWAIVTLALNTGCRAGELWGLRWTEVDRNPATPSVMLLDTKNTKNRSIPLNEDALAALEVLAKIQVKDGYVLPRQAYGGWFRLALKAAKVEAFTFHCLRHSFASRLVDAGVDITTVAKLMGHSNIQQTMRYAHPAPQHLAEAVSKITVSKTVSSTETSTEMLIAV